MSNHRSSEYNIAKHLGFGPFMRRIRVLFSGEVASIAQWVHAAFNERLTVLPPELKLGHVVHHSNLIALVVSATATASLRPSTCASGSGFRSAPGQSHSKLGPSTSAISTYGQRCGWCASWT